MPSGRTGRVAVRSFSFQTAMCNTSSGPITYDGPPTPAVAPALASGAAVLAVWAALCSRATLLISSNVTAALEVSVISSPIELPLSRPVLLKANLLQLVEQRLVADLQLLRGPPPIPARAC